MRVVYLLSLVLFILLPLALGVSEVSLEKDGSVLEYVRFGELTTADLIFKPDPGDKEVQIKWQGPTRTEGVRSLVYDCDDVCKVSVSFIPTTYTISFTFTNGDGLKQTENWQFKSDSQPPSITLTGWASSCDQSCSYNGDRSIEFEVIDEEKIDVNSIKMTIGSSNVPVDCEAGIGKHVCSADLSGSLSGEAVISASDVAGNTQSITFSLRYDNTPPIIIADPLFEGRQNDLPGGSTVVLNVIVNEPEAAWARFIPPNDFFEDGAIDTNSYEEVACSRGTNGVECSIPITLPSKEYTGTGTVVVRDPAGNTDQRSVALDIRPVDDTSEPDFWDFGAYSPTIIDTNTWSVVSKYMTVTIKLRPKSSNVKIIDMNIDTSTCLWEVPDGMGQAPNIAVSQEGPVDISGSTASIILKLDPAGELITNPESTLHDASIRCTITTKSKIGNVLFKNPESDDIVVKPRLSILLRDPQRAIDERKDKLQQDIDDKQRSLDQIQLVVAGISRVCAVRQVLQTGASTLSLTAAILVANPFTTATAGSVSYTSSGLDLSNAFLQKSLNGICEWTSCDLSKPSIGGILESIPGVDERYLDPYKSSIIAALTRCGPALLYHRQMKVYNDCSLLSCLEKAKETGVSVAECEKVNSQLDCERTAGQIYYSIPWTNMFSSISDRIEGVFKNPYSIIGLVSGTVCGGFINLKGTSEDSKLIAALPKIPRIACQVAVFPKKVAPYVTAYKLIDNNKQFFERLSGSSRKTCEQFLSEDPGDNLVLPFEFGQSCSPGYTSLQAGDKFYVAMGGNVDDESCSFVDWYLATNVNELDASDTPLGGAGSNAAAESIVGTDLKKVNIPSDVKKRACQKHINCMKSTGITDLKDTSQFRELDSAAKEYYDLNRDYEAKEKELNALSNDFNKKYRDLKESISGELSGYLPEDFDDQFDRWVSDSCDNNKCDFLETLADPDERTSGLSGDTLEFDSELISSLNDIKEKKSELRKKEEELDRDYEKVNDAKNELDEKRKVFESMVAYAEWQGPGNAARSLLSYSALWGDVTGMVISFGGGTPQKIPFLSSKISEKYASIGEEIGKPMDWVEDSFIKKSCSKRFENTIEPVQAFVGGGKTAARLSAVKSRDNINNKWDYSIDVYLDSSGVNGNVDLVLNNPGSAKLASYPPGRLSANTGADAKSFVSEVDFDEACLVFPEKLKNYFTSTFQADLDSNLLCTSVSEVLI